jgi:glycosyltransferase 2 family protein
MLVALWQFDTEDLVVGLLLFRLLYYLVPFGISLAILGCREIWLSVHATRQEKYRDRNDDDGANSDKPSH